MRTSIILGLLVTGLVAQEPERADARIQTELQTVLDLAAPPKDGETPTEEEAKTRAELFKRSLDAFITRWKDRAGELSTGRFHLGKALALAGRPAEAIPHLASFVELHPTSPEIEEALLTLASAHLSKGAHEDAVRVLSRFLSERPESAQRRAAQFYLGIARYEQGRIEEALTQLKEVAASGEETPIVADANLKLLEILRDTGRIDEARSHLEPLLERYPEAPYLQAMKEQLERLGKPAPELVDIERWLQGEATKLADLHGSVVVLNFFADFYEASVDELQALGQIAKELEDRPVVFIALTKLYRPLDKFSADEQAAIVQELLQEQGVPFRAGIAREFTNLRNYGVRGLPTTFVIDKDGRIAYVQTGSTRKNPRAREALVKAIERAAE